MCPQMRLPNPEDWGWSKTNDRWKPMCPQMRLPNPEDCGWSKTNDRWKPMCPQMRLPNPEEKIGVGQKQTTDGNPSGQCSLKHQERVAS